MRPSGGSYGTENGTSYANAWDGFANVNWATVDTGNGTLWVCATHNEGDTVTSDGEEGTPIVIDGDCSTQGGVDGTIDKNNSGDGFVLLSRSWITVRNLTFTEVNDDAIDGGLGDNLVVEYNTFNMNVAGSAQMLAMRGADSSNATFQYNTLTMTDTAGQKDGVFFARGTGGHRFIGNKIIDYSTSSGHNDCFQFYQNASGTITVANNYCEKDASINKTQNAQGVYIEEPTGHFDVYGNVFVFPESANAIAFRLPNSGGSLNAYNNTFIDVDNGAYNATRHFWIDGGSTSVTVNIKNNIFYNSDSATQSIDLLNTGSATLDIDYNHYYCPNNSTCTDSSTWAAWQSAGHDANGSGISTDPSLDSDHRPDASDDPTVAAGAVLGAAYDDGLSTNMTVATWIAAFETVDRDSAGGAAWDIGAYEYEDVSALTHTITGLNCSGCSH